MPFPDTTPLSSIISTSSRVSKPTSTTPQPPQRLTLTDRISFGAEESPPKHILARMYIIFFIRCRKTKNGNFIFPPVVIVPRATFRQLLFYKKKLSFSQQSTW